VVRIWEKERIPEEWKLSIVCWIHKKADKLNWQNYMGILLLCTFYKIFTIILKNKSEPYLKK
jgi:hypothetical protein